jgi:hypothetical protein
MIMINPLIVEIIVNDIIDNDLFCDELHCLSIHRFYNIFFFLNPTPYHPHAKCPSVNIPIFSILRSFLRKSDYQDIRIIVK